LLAGDAAPIAAICAALQLRGIAPLPVFVASLKAPSSIACVVDVLARCTPAAVITTTAFAAADGLFDALDAPLFQLALAVTRREGWTQSDRGLGSADLAMNILLPEVDGRILGGVVAFKHGDDADFGGLAAVPEADRVAQAVDRIARWIALQRTPRTARP
jgi:cobaltochelatase CobN